MVDSAPYYRNYGKRLVKAPKLYFLDTGVAAFLLGIENEHQLNSHPLKGNLFENLVFGELLKSRFNAGRISNLYFYRDRSGHEVDFVLDHGASVRAVEVKLGRTIVSDYFKSLTYLGQVVPSLKQCYVVYGGTETRRQLGSEVIPYRSLPGFVDQCRP